jgi:hypothetical protein
LDKIWSAVNIQKSELLTKQELMQPAGLARFENRKENKSEIYSYQNEEVKFSPELKKQFKAKKNALDLFSINKTKKVK